MAVEWEREVEGEAPGPWIEEVPYGLCVLDDCLHLSSPSLAVTRRTLRSAAKRGVNLVCFFQSAVAFIPIHVLHECIYVHCGI